jgi:MoaA/NifB/PqqE/SkfB family radical SAM enzyme
MKQRIIGPQEMKLELTRRCQLHCVHCSVSARSGDRTILPAKITKRLIDDFSKIGGTTVVFTGGEPLLYPFLYDVVREAKSRRLKVSVYTTGIVVDENTNHAGLKDITRIAPFVDEFIFCLHGASAPTHDYVSAVVGSFTTTVMAIKHAVSLGSRVTLHHVPLRVNIGELPGICQIASSIGIQSLKILRFVPQGRGMENRSMLELQAYDLSELRRYISQANNLFPHLRLNTGTPYYRLLSLGESIHCSAGLDTISINAVLECSPCDGLKYLENSRFVEPLGDRCLLEFWTNSNMLNTIRYIRQDVCGKEGCIAQEIIRRRLSLSNNAIELTMDYESEVVSI